MRAFGFLETCRLVKANTVDFGTCIRTCVGIVTTSLEDSLSANLEKDVVRRQWSHWLLINLRLGMIQRGHVWVKHCRRSNRLWRKIVAHRDDAKDIRPRLIFSSVLKLWDRRCGMANESTGLLTMMMLLFDGGAPLYLSGTLLRRGNSFETILESHHPWTGVGVFYWTTWVTRGRVWAIPEKICKI